LWRSRQGERPLAAAPQMLDDVAADKSSAAYDQAYRLLGLGFRVHLAYSSPGNLESLNPAFIEDRWGRAKIVMQALAFHILDGKA